MRSAGVPLPLGDESTLTSVPDVLAAAEAIRQQHADAEGVVIELDNSGTGEGNRIGPRAPRAAPRLPGRPSSPWSRVPRPT